MEYFIKAHPSVFREMRLGITDWVSTESSFTEEELDAGVVGCIRIPLIEDQDMDPGLMVINLKNQMVINKFYSDEIF